MREKDKFKQIIADRIYWLRTEVLGMTQLELAYALKISAQAIISNYETGLIRPSMRRCQMMIDLAKSKGKNIDYKFLRPDQLFKE